MLAHKAASVNTLVALCCNFAKRISNDFHSLRSSYPGNVWYSASAESNRSLSFDSSLQATLRSQTYVIQKTPKVFAGVNESNSLIFMREKKESIHSVKEEMLN